MGIYSAKPETSQCAQKYDRAQKSVYGGYDKLMEYFMYQYQTNVNYLKSQVYEACQDNVCLEAAKFMVAAVSGDGTNCDLLQVLYDGNQYKNPYYQGWRDQFMYLAAYALDLSLLSISLNVGLSALTMADSDPTLFTPWINVQIVYLKQVQAALNRVMQFD